MPQEAGPSLEKGVQDSGANGSRTPEVDQQTRRAGRDRLLKLLTELRHALARDRFRGRDEGEEDRA